MILRIVKKHCRNDTPIFELQKKGWFSIWKQLYWSLEQKKVEDKRDQFLQKEGDVYEETIWTNDPEDTGYGL